MKTLITIIALISISPVFADTLEKVDANTVKITTTQEKTYTYEDLANRIAQLKGDRDGVQRNLDLLNANIAGLEKQLADVEKAGVGAKVIEDEATVKGE
jgi:peptidoglycan hydrolase CwlO-like protein